MTLISCKNAFNSTYFLCYTYIALSFTTYAYDAPLNKKI